MGQLASLEQPSIDLDIILVDMMEKMENLPVFVEVFTSLPSEAMDDSSPLQDHYFLNDFEAFFELTD